MDRQRHQMRRSRVLAVSLSSVLMGYAALAVAGGLQINPQLESAAAAPLASATPSAGSSVAAAPLSVSGYAQWKAPARTLEQMGSGYAESRSSFGDALPISKAVHLILPQGWRVYAQKGVSGAITVTWHAHHVSWLVPLREVLRQSGLIGTVNWPHQALLLRVRPMPKVPPLRVKGYTRWGSSSSANSSVHSGLPSSFHVGRSKILPLPSLSQVVPVFSLQAGRLIEPQLRSWAKQSGWKVIWQLPEDWQVPNTTTFTGDFQQAVTRVVEALAANGANIHAVFHTANNTVVIGGAGGGE